MSDTYEVVVGGIAEVWRFAPLFREVFKMPLPLSAEEALSEGWEVATEDSDAPFYERFSAPLSRRPSPSPIVVYLYPHSHLLQAEVLFPRPGQAGLRPWVIVTAQGGDLFLEMLRRGIPFQLNGKEIAGVSDILQRLEEQHG